MVAKSRAWKSMGSDKASNKPHNYTAESIGWTLVNSNPCDEQLDYQAKVPIAYVSAELFNQWDACYQIPKEQDWYRETFSIAELKVLQEFDAALEAVSKSRPRQIFTGRQFFDR